MEARQTYRLVAILPHRLRLDIAPAEDRPQSSHGKPSRRLPRESRPPLWAATSHDRTTLPTFGMRAPPPPMRTWHALPINHAVILTLPPPPALLTTRKRPHSANATGRREACRLHESQSDSRATCALPRSCANRPSAPRLMATQEAPALPWETASSLSRAALATPDLPQAMP